MVGEHFPPVPPAQTTAVSTSVPVPGTRLAPAPARRVLPVHTQPGCPQAHPPRLGEASLLRKHKSSAETELSGARGAAQAPRRAPSDWR